MPRIHTLTCNPLWETTWTLPAWKVGATVRATSASHQLGGKGVNVARVLDRLGAPSTAIVFLGGAPGEEAARWLGAQQRVSVVLRQQADTRRGLVARCEGAPETTFLGPDVPLDTAACVAAARHLASMPREDWLAICGSVPGFSPEVMAPLADAMRLRAEAGTLVLDTYGPVLAWAVAELPLALVKINRAELSSLLGRAIASAGIGEALHDAAARSPQVRAWIVTDGPGPVWLRESGNGEARAFAPVPLAGPEASATGAGDAFLAAVLAERVGAGRAWDEAIPWAQRVAAAKVTSWETTDFPVPSRV